MDDFALIDKKLKVKCYKCGKKNKSTDEPFYITEWELSTGASTDGIYYCESCILGDGYVKR